ncbi:phosphocholine-specific phospholipase C [Nitrospirillum pindoramense]|uniref:phospholipase C n=1 Tax=Nitrospirillum amazonense TaxID=28077 RepID=A0A560GYE0_9PROT|nr:phospholipase C, phosphocholine-specific [Nitrospirillum amazonense]TWB39047.1 phospholipase C [Nitrospirillum amazonense]
MMDRRSLLRHALGGVALAGLPPALARAAAIPADVRTGTLEDVAHIVVLMQENRGFDHYFGTLSGVCGFGDRFPIPVPPGPDGQTMTVWDQRDRTDPHPRIVNPFHLSTKAHFELMRMLGTPHQWNNAQAAWDNGRMAHWPEAKTQRAMGYYTREDIPFQFAMAEAFTLCDAYHCAMHTGTNTNRLFLWTGTNDPHGKGGGPAIDNPDDDLKKPDAASIPRFSWTTYPERLEAAGVTWGHYQDMADNFGDNPLANFLQYRAAYRGDPGSRAVLRDKGLSTRALDKLREDVLADRLPQISWVVGTEEGSEHPGPSSPAQGAAYTAQVIDALTANPKVWARTVLFITFDENDGFFDHAPPPAPPSPDPDAPGGFAGASTAATDDDYHRLKAPGADGDDLNLRGRPYGLGPRVPCYILSPWSRGGWVHSEVADHTSIIRFMEKRFGVMEPNISPWRRAVCGDLTTAFDFKTPNAKLPTLPETAPTRERARAIVGQAIPETPVAPPHPVQEAGTRPSRRLRYALEVSDHVDSAAGTIRLDFVAGAGQGAVFHVYDRLRLDAIPRRYTVEAGRTLSGEWHLTGPEGAYDLWVRGPNGFHRAFTGTRMGTAGLSWAVEGDALRITVAPGGGADVTVQPAAYKDQHRAWTPGPEGGVMRWPLRPTLGWYDLLITGEHVQRRLAGRVDGDWPASTDPALASPAAAG